MEWLCEWVVQVTQPGSAIKYLTVLFSCLNETIKKLLHNLTTPFLRALVSTKNITAPVENPFRDISYEFVERGFLGNIILC